MSTALKTKLRTQAAADAGLTALLQSGSPPFLRWYDTQLEQGQGYPAVVVQLISNPRQHVATGILPTSWARVQFTIWGGAYDAGTQACESVVAALKSFLNTFNGVGIAAQVAYPAVIMNIRDGMAAQPEGPIFQKLLDAMIFSNDSV